MLETIIKEPIILSRTFFRKKVLTRNAWMLFCCRKDERMDREIFYQLLQKYGSHEAVSKAVGITSRTLWNWRKGRISRLQAKRAEVLLQNALCANEPSPTSDADSTAT